MGPQVKELLFAKILAKFVLHSFERPRFAFQTLITYLRMCAYVCTYVHTCIRQKSTLFIYISQLYLYNAYYVLSNT
jgi:hypothetical protein